MCASAATESVVALLQKSNDVDRTAATDVAGVVAVEEGRTGLRAPAVDASPRPVDTRGDRRASGRRGAEGAGHVLVVDLGIVAVVTLVAMVVERRRGPSGSSRNVDFNSNNRFEEQYRNKGPTSGGGMGGSAAG